MYFLVISYFLKKRTLIELPFWTNSIHVPQENFLWSLNEIFVKCFWRFSKVSIYSRFSLHIVAYPCNELGCFEPSLIDIGLIVLVEIIILKNKIKRQLQLQTTSLGPCAIYPIKRKWKWVTFLFSQNKNIKLHTKWQMVH